MLEMQHTHTHTHTRTHTIFALPGHLNMSSHHTRCCCHQVFVPPTEDMDTTLHKHGWYRAGFLAVQSLLGWPMYLVSNASGRPYSRWANHFDPTSPIFSVRERPGIVASDLGFVAMLYCLYRAGSAWGWAWLAK